jgi:hypothetical protein
MFELGLEPSMLTCFTRNLPPCFVGRGVTQSTAMVGRVSGRALANLSLGGYDSAQQLHFHSRINDLHSFRLSLFEKLYRDLTVSI